MAFLLVVSWVLPDDRMGNLAEYAIAVNLAQRIEWQNELRKVGIPWRSFPAVFTCAMKINAGTTYLVAMQYAEALLRDETFPQACQALLGYRNRLGQYYSYQAHETGRYRRDWAVV